ncbi:hypothetical protein [Mycobacterium sp. 141]|uniref:hypothetical protein n=1 Tax=Mycobacterium sp. 141 TaxID=1120797 RepID=UPI000376DF17|nr:hypothetical protein [Mycobacterium sp. 141]
MTPVQQYRGVDTAARLARRRDQLLAAGPDLLGADTIGATDPARKRADPATFFAMPPGQHTGAMPNLEENRLFCATAYFVAIGATRTISERLVGVESQRKTP